MNSTEEIRTAELERRIARHLEEIDAALSQRGQDIMARRSVTNDVESQIRDMLASRAATGGSAQPPSVADVEAVLAELDSPASYANAISVGEERPPAPMQGRLSRAAVIGACWLPMGFIFFLLFFSVHVAVSSPGNAPPPGPSLIEEIALIAIGALGVTSPFGTTAMGIIAISQIRRSSGALYGLILALIDALFYPLLLLDILLGVLVYHAYAIAANWHEMGINAISHPNRAAADENFGMVLAIAVALGIIVDYLIIKRIGGSLGGKTNAASTN